MEQFWARVNKTESCWLWLGHKDKDGYGRVYFKKKQRGAHRVAWELTNGFIPSGLCVLHECDNPPCVNPEHLFLGTHRDNMRDMAKKGRRVDVGSPGETNSQARLTYEDVKLIRELYALGNTSHKKLGIRFGVSSSCIALIVTGKHWNKGSGREDTCYN